jgi:hypothetical protein
MTLARPTGNQNGMAMAVCLFVLAMLSGLTVAALSMSQTDIVRSHNYESGVEGLAAAEAGVAHAVQLIDQVGVVNLHNDFIAVWGGAAPFNPHAMNQNTTYSYSVALADDPYHAVGNRGLITSTATGPDNSVRIVEAFIIKSDIPNAPPGAVYLATDNTSNATFNGNSFAINGNDVNYTNGLAGPASAVPGIATRTEANATEARSSLNAQQSNNVQGAGYVPGNPATPSIATTQQAPTTAQIDQMITDLLALPHQTYTQSNFSGNQTFGTIAAPQISYFNNASGVTMGNGNVSGAGILIVDNSLTLNGNLDFKGLVLVRGSTNVTQVTGSADIWGAIWTTDFNLTVGGHADVQYSSQALALANLAGGPGGGGLPAPVKIYSWRDSY